MVSRDLAIALACGATPEACINSKKSDLWSVTAGKVQERREADGKNEEEMGLTGRT